MRLELKEDKDGETRWESKSGLTVWENAISVLVRNPKRVVTINLPTLQVSESEGDEVAAIGLSTDRIVYAEDDSVPD